MKLVQYKIHLDMPQGNIKQLARRFLKNDKHWHFLHEGIYSLIRTTKRNKPLEKFFNKKDIRFDIGIWEDPHPTVRKYQDEYCQIFHAYTLLGLKYAQNEADFVINRAIHCLLNMMAISGPAESIVLGIQFTKALTNFSYFGSKQNIRDMVSETALKPEAF